MRQRPEVHEIYRRWQEIAGEYIPKPTLMGETYVPLDKLFDYYAHLDLAQNFPFLRAEFELDELRPIVETTMKKLPKGREARLVRVEPRSLAHGDPLGGRRRAQAQGRALPAPHAAGQRDPLPGRRARPRGRRRPGRPHPRPRRPAARSRAHAVPVDAQRRGMAEPVAPADRHLAQRRGQHDPPVHARADRAAQGARRRLPHARRAPTACGRTRAATRRACST